MSQREELRDEIATDYLGQHPGYFIHEGEVYEFDIKIRRINIPDAVRENLSVSAIGSVADDEAIVQLGILCEEVKGLFPWVEGCSQAGRSGGWFLINTHDAVWADSHDNPADLKRVKRRLRELRAIEDLVDRAKREYVKALESIEWWVERNPGQFWIRPGKKEWRPDPDPDSR